MSQAFVKENDDQWLHEIQPTLNALLVYVTRDNNGIRVYEQKNHIDPNTRKQVYQMSNGLSYSHDQEGRWCVV
ncbi:MAG: hypothetical protein ABIO04_12625 [Ferruginibacter sp.]